jgi:hypothetical protein
MDIDNPAAAATGAGSGAICEPAVRSTQRAASASSVATAAVFRNLIG